MSRCRSTRRSLLLLALGLAHWGNAADDRQLQAAVNGGLRWLQAHQLTQGSAGGGWDAPRAEYRPAVASLAGLAFLANGHTPAQGRYAGVVRGTLAYVMGAMAPDGYLGQGDRSGMYIHAMCTLFGLSCLGMTEDAALELALAEWCRQAVKVTVEAQETRRAPVDRGGWRYSPYTSESDVSVSSWQLLSLHAARQCGFVVDQQVFDGALRYINSAYRELENDQAGFVYRPGVSDRTEYAVTGAALFVKSVFQLDDTTKVAHIRRYLESFPATWGGRQYGNYFFFSSFYQTLGVFQLGASDWQRHANALRDLLLQHQSGDGSWPFPPDNTPQSRLAGPAYPTAMSVLMLSLDRQYLPMYQRQKRLF